MICGHAVGDDVTAVGGQTRVDITVAIITVSQEVETKSAKKQNGFNSHHKIKAPVEVNKIKISLT